MALVTEKPEELTPENDLDNIVDPDDDEAPGGPPVRADIYLSGAVIAQLSGPPGFGDRFQMLVELEVIEEGTKSLDGGATRVPVRRCRRVGDMWLPGGPRPEPKKSKAEKDAEAEAEAAENQPPLYDDAGEPVDGTDWDSTEPDADPDTEDDDNVIRPPFSDGPR